MMKPDHNPQATQANALHYVHTAEVPDAFSIVNVLGSKKMSGMTAPVMRTVEIMSYHLTMDSTLS